MSIVSEKYKKINLIQLQNDVSDIVFNYIDTSQNWEKAYSYLDELLNTTVNHFQNSNSKGQMDSFISNTYWVLFLNIMSRLIYFHTISYKEMKKNSSELSKENVLSLICYAAKCLPNTKNEDNQQFFEEMKQTVEQLGGSVEEFEKIAQKNNEDPTSCFAAFKEYCELYF